MATAVMLHLVSGATQVQVEAPFTLILSGTNTFSGGAMVDGGRLVLLHAYDLPNGSALTIGDPMEFASSAAGAIVAPQAVTAVPEPGGLAIVIAAGIAAVAFRRRFRLALPRRFA